MKKIRNIVLAGAMATTLTACGGGGGGAGTAIKNFVQDDLSNLAGSESIINSYSNLLSGFNSTISSGNFASLSAIMTGPNEADISKANNLLTMLDQAETLWSQTLTLIESQDADTKLSIYNSDDYKNAHAALLYLKNHVKPIIQKVSQGEKLSLTEYNKVASDKKAQELIKTWEEGTQMFNDLQSFFKNGINNLTGLMALFLKFAGSNCNRKLSGAKNDVGWYPLFGTTNCTPEELATINGIRGHNRGDCGENDKGGGYNIVNL